MTTDETTTTTAPAEPRGPLDVAGFFRPGMPVWFYPPDGTARRADSVAAPGAARGPDGDWSVALLRAGGPVPLDRVAYRPVTLRTLRADSLRTRREIARLLADGPANVDEDGLLARTDAELARLVAEYERRIDHGQV